jgi:hypothetical protein
MIHVLRSRSVCGMHQPVPDPPDLRLLSVQGQLSYLMACQEAMAEWGRPGFASVQQERPGVVLVDEEDRYPDKICVGLSRILERLESEGAIKQVTIAATEAP